MLTTSEETYIKNHAYVPEHITGYVASIAEGEPFLSEDYLWYSRKGHLIFIGYPLQRLFRVKEMQGVLDTAIKLFNPEQIALIAPAVLISYMKCSQKNSDSYCRLNLSNLYITPKLKNTIKRASRELYIEKNRELKGEHIQLISEFLNTRKVNEGTKYIFERIPKYILSVTAALVFSARDKTGRLVAFDIAEFGAKDYAFYMFNFMDQDCRVPGASDFLLYEVIKAAQERGKLFVNLGLGINKGVSFFKKKWGGVPFLNYEFCLYDRDRKDRLKSLLERLVQR